MELEKAGATQRKHSVRAEERAKEERMWSNVRKTGVLRERRKEGQRDKGKRERRKEGKKERGKEGRRGRVGCKLLPQTVERRCGIEATRQRS